MNRGGNPRRSFRREEHLAGERAPGAPTRGGNRLRVPALMKLVPGSGCPEAAVFLAGGAFLVLGGLGLLSSLETDARWRALTVIGIGGILASVAIYGLARGRLPWPIGPMVRTIRDRLGIGSVQGVLLLLAPGLSLVAWLAAGDRGLMTAPALAVGSWLLGMLLVLAGSLGRRMPICDSRWSRAEILAVVAILIAAFLLRVLHLADIPWLFTGDEGSAGLSAVAFLQGRHNNVFVMGAGSFPSLYFFLESLTIRLFGQTIVAARLPAALVGALTTVGLYVFSRAAFGRSIALASAAYLATFPIHIQFSRTGLNDIWDSLTLVVVSAALWLAWERNHPALFATAGLALGLGQYFYSTSRLLCGILLVWLIAASIFDRRRLRERLPGLGLLLLAFLTSVLPLVLMYSQYPDEFAAPYVRVSIFGSWMEDALQQSQGPLWTILWSQLRASALAFANLPLHGYYAGAPMLLPVAAGLFFLGTVLAAFHLPALQNAWILICLAAAVATGMFSVETPSSQRYLFTTPFVALLAVLPVVTSVRWLGGIWPRLRPWLLAAGLVLITTLIWADLRYYFGTYSAGRLFGDRNTEVATRVAEYLGERQPGTRVYFAGFPRMGYFTHKTIAFLAPTAVGADIPLLLAAAPDFDLTGPTVFIVLPERASDLDYIRRSYPDGSLQVVYGRGGRLLFSAYLVNGP